MPKRKATASAASTMASSKPTSHKRKRKPGEARFYAVRVGRVPGVYGSWAECQAMINAYPGAVYKAFPSRDEALLFIAGKNPNPNSEPDRFYAVAVGKRPGIYTDWVDAQAAYTGVKAPKYKKFDSREAAEKWMTAIAQSTQQQSSAMKGEEDEEEEVDENYDEDEDEAKYEDEDEFKYEDEIEDEGTEHVTKKIKQEAGLGDDQGMVNIFTDGSALSNGKKSAIAGVGVYFGDNDPRNISERLAGEVQTNQRAELTAILRALETVPVTQAVVIWSDSMYAIKCVTEWFVKWESNGWRTTKGPVQNRDLVEMVLREIRRRDTMGTKTVIKWIKGHENNRGNIEADELAVKGAHGARASLVSSGMKR